MEVEEKRRLPDLARRPLEGFTRIILMMKVELEYCAFQVKDYLTDAKATPKS